MLKRALIQTLQRGVCYAPYDKADFVLNDDDAFAYGRVRFCWECKAIKLEYRPTRSTSPDSTTAS